MKTEHQNLGSQDAEALDALEQHIENFVVDNDDLFALESLIGKFNIFDALGIARREIDHSNFLAFILDPAESHGQGQLFLTALLMDILKATPAASRPFSPIELDGTDLRGVEVKREWEHIDLLITSRQPSFVVAIENKVDSYEHNDQLRRYEKIVRDKHPTDRPLFIYLTPNKDEPSADNWVPYSYADIHGVLERVRTGYHNSIGDDVLVFLDHYLSLIGSRFMNNAKIDELCQRIYKNHRQAIKLIYQRAASPESVVLCEAETFLNEDPRWHVFSRRGSTIYFVPKAWLDWLPPLGLDRKEEPQSWFTLRFDTQKNTNKLDLYVEVGRMEDIEKRRKIVKVLIADPTKYGFKHSGREPKDTSTTVSGRERVWEWSNDDEPDPSKNSRRSKKQA